MRAETESWRLVMKTFRKMNELVSTDAENVLDQAIDDYKDLLAGAESAVLRWVDNQEAGQQTRALLDSLLKGNGSKAKELAGSELKILAETGYDVLLPRGVKRVLLAEVSCGAPLGVLEICGKEDVPFLPHSTALSRTARAPDRPVQLFGSKKEGRPRNLWVISTGIAAEICIRIGATARSLGCEHKTLEAHHRTVNRPFGVTWRFGARQN